MQRTEQFRLTGIVWHEVPIEKSIYNTNAVADLLNQHLHLQAYGDEIDFIFFIFIIDLPNSIHEECHRFHRKRRFLDIELKLDYFEVMAATPEEVKHLMASLFVDSILLYKKMRLKNFDSLRFYADVKSLFETHGLVKEKKELQA